MENSHPRCISTVMLRLQTEYSQLRCWIRTFLKLRNLTWLSSILRTMSQRVALLGKRFLWIWIQFLLNGLTLSLQERMAGVPRLFILIQKLSLIRKEWPILVDLETTAIIFSLSILGLEEDQFICHPLWRSPHLAGSRSEDHTRRWIALKSVKARSR